MRRLPAAACTALAVLATLVSASEAAPRPKPTKQQLAVVEHRQAQMKQLGASMKTLSAFARGDLTDVGQMRAAAATMSRVGGAMPHLWPAGTQVGVGDSSTRASLWKERQELAQRIAQFQTAAAGLNAAAATGRREEVADRMKAVGASCKTCHDAWRVVD